jgi:hypothetical protein
MKTMPVLLFAAFVVVAVAGLSWSQDKSPQASPAKPAPPPDTQAAAPSLKTNADYPVIGYLEKRGRTITIKAGPKGALDSIKAKAPELAEFLKTAVAGVPGTKADARLRVMRLY